MPSPRWRRSPSSSAATLDPELAEAVQRLPTVDFTDISVERERFDRLLAAAPPADFGEIEVSNRVVPRPRGAADIPIRVLRGPSAGAARPGVLDLHGGGMSVGRPSMNDRKNIAIVRDVDAVVVSVDYRLAPEHRFPAAFEDCYDAFLWFVEHAGELGVDPTRIAVLGYSAGGNLAAATALRARDCEAPTPAMQVLLEPMLDDRLRSGSMTSIGAWSPVWNRANAVLSWNYYLGDHPATAYAAPARMDDLSGLPPAYVTVNELDPLRDEGLRYAERLLSAGVPTEIHCWTRACHGFGGLAPSSALAARAARTLTKAMRQGLAHAS